MKKSLIISLLISLGVGGLSAFITMGSMDIYKFLDKPPLAPPAIVFPVIWTILYILMGISSYLIYESNNENKQSGLSIYGLQLLVNFIWPIFFFILNYRLIALFIIVLLLILIIIMIIKFYKINKLAAYLQIPYLIWVVFATYLNFGFYILNG